MSTLRTSKEWAINRILLCLDKRPSHGYELLEALPDELSDLRLTTLYRWLHSMEEEGYVESEMQPGPHGPERRIYSLGPRGEGKLRDVLKDAIETILHFYDAYRYSASEHLFDILDNSDPRLVNGRKLYVPIPWLRRRDTDFVEYLAKRNKNGPIDILGDTSLLCGLDVKFREMKGSFDDIPLPNDKLAEIWIHGNPRPDIIPRMFTEAKRVLKNEGVLRFVAPYAYLNEPKRPTLEEFIRVTSVHLLPDLGVVEGTEIARLLSDMFGHAGALQTLPGLVVFWAVKTSR
ncbi:PadR family transcriptional regulator [Candidatus Thorarchaeota archaeon]|nr:MAG: PadR family transcriptional regulator [Candidatus Thorarchaeota archaeon]